MSYNASQFEDITDALHRKNGKKVPKDQDDLLLQSDSWIHQLRQRPHGMANVPTRVLETVTAAYTNAIRKKSSDAAQPVASIEPKELEASQRSDVPASSPEVALEWSQSPERPRRGHSLMPESSMVEETHYPKLGQPAFRKPVTALRRLFNSTPLSSLEEEEDLEVQVPRGDNDTEMGEAEDEEAEDEEDENCHKRLTQVPPQVLLESNALIANTPTCAQQEHEIIPGTVMAEKAKTEQQNAGQRPSKRMKPILIDDYSPVKSRQNMSIANGGRMRSLKHLEIVTQDTAVSSSIVPATLTETQTQTQNASGTTQDTAEEKDLRERISGVEENASSSAAEDEAAKFTELQSATSQVSVQEDHSHSAEDEAAAPFGKFKIAYPDYETSFSGTRLDFVKACLCLEYLCNERALRDYMYDEFIRLFSHKYIAYVNNAGPNREPLSAIEWFNIQVGPPLYRQQIISNQNLEHVLAFYDDDTAAIRTLVAEHEEEEAAEMYSASQVTRVESEDGDIGEEEQEHKKSETRRHDERDVDSPARWLAAATVVSEVLESPTRAIPTELPTVQPLQAKSTPIQGRPVVAPPPSAQSAKIQRTHLRERPAISPPPSVQPVKAKMRPTPEKAAVVPSLPVVSVPVCLPSPRAAAAAAASPQLGSRTFAALPPPPSSMRSNASVGTQYMQQLSARMLPTSEEAAQQRRERMRAAMRKRASNGARSTSRKV